MNLVLLATIWLGLGAGVTVLAGLGIERGQRRTQVTPATAAVAAPAERRYVRPELVDIALAAHTAAIEDLLSTRPDSIRRVAAR